MRAYTAAGSLPCQEENISPEQPTRLALLFALDSKLNIKNGFVYMADCSSRDAAGR